MKKALYFILCALTFFSCKEENLPIMGKNAAGLTYYVKENKTPQKKAYLQLAVKAGSCNETEKQRGLAHFLEHMAFNGTKSFQGSELVAFLESMGVAFGPELNAYTSYNETVYELEVPTQNPELLETAINILQEWAFEMTLDPQQIEKERGIIIEEKRLRNTASYRDFRTMTKSLFGNSLYNQREPIGIEEVIQGATREEFLKFYKSWYVPQNMAVFIVGDIDADAVVHRLQSFEPSNPSPEPPPQEPNLTVDFDGQRHFIAFQDKELTMAQLRLWHKRLPSPLLSEEDYRKDLINNLAARIINQTVSDLILSGQSQLLELSAFDSSFVKTLSIFGTEIILPQDQIEECLVEAFGLLKGFRSGLCEQSRLDRAKDFYATRMDTLESQAQTYDSLDYLNWYKDDYLKGHKTISINSYVHIVRHLLPSITLSEVNAAFAQLLADEDSLFSLSAPRLPWSNEEAQDIMAHLWDETPAHLPPATVNDAQFFPYEPQEGSILEKTYHKEVKAYCYRLSNGVTVWARPSSLKKNSVEMNGFQWGGLSLASEKEYTSALLSTQWLNNCGWGTMSSTEIKAQLEQKNLSCRLTMDNLTHGFSAVADTTDLEALFQLLYLQLLQPNPDQKAFDLVKKTAIQMAKERENDPTETFFLKVNQRLHNQNFRYLPPTAAQLEEADSETALAFYRRLYSAKGFTFVFAGDFKEKTLEKYLIRYLASVELPQEEKKIDLSVYEPIPLESMEETVFKGVEKKSIVQIIFVADQGYSPRLQAEGNALGSILDMSLRDQIREESSGAYATQGYNILTRLPFQQSLTAAAFFCDPLRVEELISKTKSILTALSQGEFPLDYLKNHLEIEKTNLATAQQSNHYWRQMLTLHAQGQLTLEEIVQQKQLIESITPQGVKDVAARWLQEERLKLFILKPEE